MDIQYFFFLKYSLAVRPKLIQFSVLINKQAFFRTLTSITEIRTFKKIMGRTDIAKHAFIIKPDFFPDCNFVHPDDFFKKQNVTSECQLIIHGIRCFCHKQCIEPVCILIQLEMSQFKKFLMLLQHLVSQKCPDISRYQVALNKSPQIISLDFFGENISKRWPELTDPTIIMHLNLKRKPALYLIFKCDKVHLPDPDIWYRCLFLYFPAVRNKQEINGIIISSCLHPYRKICWRLPEISHK